MSFGMYYVGWQFVDFVFNTGLEQLVLRAGDFGRNVLFSAHDK